jgi:hypothetical protein
MYRIHPTRTPLYSILFYKYTSHHHQKTKKFSRLRLKEKKKGKKIDIFSYVFHIIDSSSYGFTKGIKVLSTCLEYQE